MRARTITKTAEVNRSKHGGLWSQRLHFFLLMCSGSRGILDQRITRTKMRRKRAKFWIMTFCGVGARSGGFVTWMALQKQISSKISRATFNYICQRLPPSPSLNSQSGSRQRRIVTNVDLGTNIKVSRIRTEKIRFHMICCSHCIKSQSHMSKKIWGKWDFYHFCLQSESRAAIKILFTQSHCRESSSIWEQKGLKLGFWLQQVSV